MELKFKRLSPKATLVPAYATSGAACFDIHATEYCTLGPGMYDAVHTGLAFEVPEGFALMLYSRSGHGAKAISLANSVGVIDSDYRGEVKVLLRNDGEKLVTFAPGDRIAQAMLLPLPQVTLVEVTELSETARGTGGFGSTGA